MCIWTRFFWLRLGKLFLPSVLVDWEFPRVGFKVVQHEGDSNSWNGGALRSPGFREASVRPGCWLWMASGPGRVLERGSCGILYQPVNKKITRYVLRKFQVGEFKNDADCCKKQGSEWPRLWNTCKTSGYEQLQLQIACRNNAFLLFPVPLTNLHTSRTKAWAVIDCRK